MMSLHLLVGRSTVETLEPRPCWHEFMTDRAVTQVSEWWVTLGQFLDRAERVLSCELARREDLTTVGTSGKFIASLAEGQPVVWSMERSHPPESDVESAAARLRPLFLQDERVQHGRVTNALGALAQGAPEPQRELVKLLKKAWKQHGTGYRWSLGSTRNGGSGECATTDRSPTTSCTATWCTPPTTPDSGFGASPGGAPGCCDGMGRRCHQAHSGHQATRCRPAGRRLPSPRPS